jgi:hypothetical protein
MYEIALVFTINVKRISNSDLKFDLPNFQLRVRVTETVILVLA